MRAAFIEELGPPENISHGELPAPRPGPTDVLVDVLYTTVNPVDTYIRSGAFRVPMSFPFIVGRDMVGRVAAVSPGSPGFAVGDPVWCNSLGHGGRQGAAAEQVVVPADRLYHLPAGVTPAAAVTVLHPGATAYLGLFPHGRLRVGQTVVVVGAAGNVGGDMVTLAAAAGARVVAVASARDARFCRELGAVETVDYRDPDLTQRLRRCCPTGVDLYLDAAGRNELTDAVDLLAERGRIVLLAGARTRPVLPAGQLYLKSGRIVGFVISHATTAELAAAAGTVNRLLATGQLRSRHVEAATLADLGTVHRRIEQGELHGRRVAVRVGADQPGTDTSAHPRHVCPGAGPGYPGAIVD